MTNLCAGAALLLLHVAAHSALGQANNSSDLAEDHTEEADLETTTLTPTQVVRQEFAMNNRPGTGLVVQHLSFADMSDGSIVMNVVVDSVANDSVYSNDTEAAPKVYLVKEIADCAQFPSQGKYPAQEVVVMSKLDENGQMRFSSGELSYSEVMSSCPAVLTLKNAANSSEKLDENPRGFAWSLTRLWSYVAQRETPEEDFEESCCSGERNPRLIKSPPNRLRTLFQLDLGNFNIIATGSIVRVSSVAAPASFALVAPVSPASSGSVSTWPNIILGGVNNSVLLPIAALIVAVYAVFAYTTLLAPAIQAVVTPPLGTSRAWRRFDAVVDDLAEKADVAVRGFASRIRIPKRARSHYNGHRFK